MVWISLKCNFQWDSPVNFYQSREGDVAAGVPVAIGVPVPVLAKAARRVRLAEDVTKRKWV